MPLSHNHNDGSRGGVSRRKTVQPEKSTSADVHGEMSQVHTLQSVTEFKAGGETTAQKLLPLPVDSGRGGAGGGGTSALQEKNGAFRTE